ncbi:MAG: hypothetical protein NTW87_02095 [Planctomycetota bacterium]|nr:hypothetical protein [Planctomycetota bacterium]
MAPHKRTGLHVTSLYFRALLHEFRWTLAALLALVVLGSTLYAVTPQDGARPSVGSAVYCTWMALFAQPIVNSPEAWYLKLVNGVGIAGDYTDPRKDDPDSVMWRDWGGQANVLTNAECEKFEKHKVR